MCVSICLFKISKLSRSSVVYCIRSCIGHIVWPPNFLKSGRYYARGQKIASSLLIYQACLSHVASLTYSHALSLLAMYRALLCDVLSLMQWSRRNWRQLQGLQQKAESSDIGDMTVRQAAAWCEIQDSTEGPSSPARSAGPQPFV